MKLCLFGGTFDPVHTGHITIAEAALRTAGVERIVFLPAARSPFKTGNRTLFTADQRLTMLRTATRELSWAEVSDLDLTLPPPSWSWRIVEYYRAEYPHDELFWLMGTDQWNELHRWGRYEYLTEQLTFVVYHRGEPPTSRPNVNAVFVEGNHPAAASAIRHSLLHHTPVPDGWLHPQVAAYAEHFVRENERKG